MAGSLTKIYKTDDGATVQTYGTFWAGIKVDKTDNALQFNSDGTWRSVHDSGASQNLFGDGTASLPSITFVGDTGTGLSRTAAGHVSYSRNGSRNFTFATDISLKSTSALLWTDGDPYSGTADVFLRRDAANTLALRNGTNAQIFNIYGTYTDASNYERLRIRTTASLASIFTENAGTGSARSLLIGTAGSASLVISTNATQRWSVNASGHFLADADNTYDIGASSATRPRGIYVGTGGVTSGASVVATDGLQAGADNSIRFNGRARLKSPADGVATLLNAAETDFSRLQFGGTTSSFPSLKRSSTTIDARLADDSAYAPLRASVITAANGGLFMGFGSYITDTADGVVRLTNNAATDFSRLAFGGTTSSFPALKRSGAGLLVRLADDSDYAEIVGVIRNGIANITATDGGSTAAFTANMVGATGGPTTAAQNGWMRMKDSTGANVWVPIWK